MDHNPWLVESVQAFSYLKCSECGFDTKEENLFENHATENHPMSLVFFVKEFVKKETCDLNIKSEPPDTIYETENHNKEFEYSNLDYPEETIKEEFDGTMSEKESDVELFESPKDPENDPFKDQVHEVKKSYSCDICSHVFNTKSYLSRHISTVHDNDTFPIVEFSGNDPLLISDLKESIFHEQEKPFPCSECKASFSLNGNLKKHIGAVHEGKRPFKCSECDSSFTHKGNMNMHIAAVHEGKKPFKCSICDSSFLFESRMNQHIAVVHEGKRPFKCSQCETSFTSKVVMERHISSVHEGKKPFSCTICDKKISKKCNLKDHILSMHEGKKPFKCTLCSRSFANKSKLNKHISGHS